MTIAGDQPVFVWIKGMRGPERQKWALRSRTPGADHYWEDKIISVHPITQEQFDTLTLDQLEGLFPRPGARVA